MVDLQPFAILMRKLLGIDVKKENHGDPFQLKMVQIFILSFYLNQLRY